MCSTDNSTAILHCFFHSTPPAIHFSKGKTVSPLHSGSNINVSIWALLSHQYLIIKMAPRSWDRKEHQPQLILGQALPHGFIFTQLATSTQKTHTPSQAARGIHRWLRWDRRGFGWFPSDLRRLQQPGKPRDLCPSAKPQDVLRGSKKLSSWARARRPPALKQSSLLPKTSPETQTWALLYTGGQDIPRIQLWKYWEQIFWALLDPPRAAPLSALPNVRRSPWALLIFPGILCPHPCGERKFPSALPEEAERQSYVSSTLGGILQQEIWWEWEEEENPARGLSCAAPEPGK